MAFSIGAVATRFSATPVSQGERAREGVWRNLKTSEQGVLTLAQAGGRIPFGVVPSLLHSACSITHRITAVKLIDVLWEFARIDAAEIFNPYVGLLD